MIWWYDIAYYWPYSYIKNLIINEIIHELMIRLIAISTGLLGFPSIDRNSHIICMQYARASSD